MFDFTDANWTTTYRGVVTAWDCDHVGHLNIAHYVSRFDESHWPFFGEVGLTPVFLRDYGCGMAAVEQHIRYLKELRAGDVVAIRSRVVGIRSKVLLSEHVLVDDTTGIACAHEKITCAFLDLTARRAVEFPPEIVAQIERRLAHKATQ
jgi:acyl-CoA thioester hydrolase